MGRPAEQLLEFDELREIVAGFTTCPPGRRVIESLYFHTNRETSRDALEPEFALIREAVGYLRSGSELGFGSLADPDAWLPKIAIPAAVLSNAELLDALTLLDASSAAHQVFRPVADKLPLLDSITKSLSDFRRLATAIRRAILPNGEISDDASSELRRIRGTIHQTRDRIQKSLEQILRARGNEAGQDYVTLRNDRFVIPVRSSDRRAVPGVVHSASATGQTVFVEPLDTIEFNNRLVQLSEDEAAEIARILAELTDQLRLERGPLEFAAATIAHVDSLFARARYAREFNCVMPEFAGGNSLQVEDVRNPVLEKTLRERDRQAVPMSLSLGHSAPDDRGGTVMVISGPNTGGKSVALKTTGLAALAAQSGIPVAAQRAVLPMFDRVLVDIGDEQSIAADLSTFSAHILNLKSMLELATPESLALVDEMGTGTAPEEGAALAVALLDEFRAKNCIVLATTHHDRLKAYASATPGVVNAAVEFDNVNLRPTYRLMVGVPGGSSGIEIARRLGLPVSIVDRARSEMSPEALESRDLIAYLHRTRDEMEELRKRARQELEEVETERRSLRTEWTERQKRRINELEKSFAETQKRLQSEVTRLAADISDRKLRAQLEKSGSRRLSKIEAEARAETDAAVVETLAASQADLGVSLKLRHSRLLRKN